MAASTSTVSDQSAFSNANELRKQWTTRTSGFPHPFQLLQKPWPWSVRVLVVLVLYGGYFLLGGGLIGERMPYDAGHYWELAVSFQRQHRDFSLLHFNDPTRGYMAAAVQLPALVVRLLLHCSMPTAAKVAGLGWASALLAWAVPGVWQSVVQRPIAGGRWLFFVALSFVFWRDHFSFTTTDMPALTLLLLALWGISCRHIGWWLLAGVWLAAALNCRPVYVASVLPALALCWWWSRQHGGQQVLRLAALVLGSGLVLAPQLAINRVHFQRNTPLVLAELPHGTRTAPLFLQQLRWGTGILRYDTDMHARHFYVDSAGLALLQHEQLRRFTSYSQFLRVLARHPTEYTVRYMRHLFNGLDVWQPAPYVLRPYTPTRFWLQLLNYSVLGVALVVWSTVSLRSWLNWPRAGVLLSILLPCAAAVPTAIESRFLLPLHLLLLVVAAFAAQPGKWWATVRQRPVRLAGAVVLSFLWLGSCYALSQSTERTLIPDRGFPMED